MITSSVKYLVSSVECSGNILAAGSALEMVTELPAQILAGEFVDSPEPVALERKRWCHRLDPVRVFRRGQT